VVRCLDGEPTPLKDSVLLLTGKRADVELLLSTTSFHEPMICIVDNIGFPDNSVICLLY
jgi:hypothetical protein